MKFKRGDKVVHVGTNWHYGKLEKLTIESSYISARKYNCYWTKENPSEPVIEEDLEFQVLLESPLNKALE